MESVLNYPRDCEGNLARGANIAAREIAGFFGNVRLAYCEIKTVHKYTNFSWIMR